MSLDFYIYDKGRNTGCVIELFHQNITHNVSPMWHKAGIYNELYNSDKSKIKGITGLLKMGLAKMKTDPEEYKKLNPPNGWGNYEHAIEFLEEVIKGCKEYPEAYVGISK